MAFKFVVLAAFVAVANAGGLIGAPGLIGAHGLVGTAGIASPYSLGASVVGGSLGAGLVSPYGLGARIASPLSLGASVVGGSLGPGLVSPYGLGVAKVAAPLAVAKTVVADEYDPNPQYSYGYQVQDALTGDAKSQTESRSGDVVKGSYSVADPDGTLRTVEYVADPINGFNAVVHKTPLAAKAVVAKVAAPLVQSAPIW